MRSAAIRSTFRWPPVAGFLFALLVTFSVLVPAPSHSQQNRPAASLTLLSQSNWTVNTPFEMVVAVESPYPAAAIDLAITVYGATPNRSSFQQSIDDRFAGSSLVLERLALSDVIRPDGTVGVSLPVHDPAQRRFFLRDNGVFPVRVDIRLSDTGEVLDRFTTHILKVSEQPATQRLAVATVFPVFAPLGRLDESSLDLPDEGAGVAAIVQAVNAHPSMPVTMLVSPETVERVSASQQADVPALLPALAALPQAREVPATSWAPISTSLFDPQLDTEVVRQFDRADAVLTSLGVAQRKGTWFAHQGLTGDAVQALDGRGFERYVVPERSLVDIRRGTTLLKPFNLSVGRGRPTVPALQADAGLSDHFNDSSQPVLSAHHLLADLTVLQNDRPSQARAAVVMPGLDWRPDETFLRTYLTALTEAPILNPTSVDDAFETPAETSGRTTLVRQFARNDESQVPVTETIRTRVMTNGFDSMVLPDNPIPAELDRTLLQSQRVALSAAERQAIRTRASNLINQQLEAIEVPPERSLRLTAREGEIPVSVQNETGYPIAVRLKLSSDKLNFTSGEERVLDIERSRITERFAIETRTTGAFPVEVVVESPDGILVLDRSRVTVRSTAASGVGLGLSIGAGLFLLIWWARSMIRSKRRAARARHPVSSAP